MLLFLSPPVTLDHIFGTAGATVDPATLPSNWPKDKAGKPMPSTNMLVNPFSSTPVGTDGKTSGDATKAPIGGDTYVWPLAEQVMCDEMVNIDNTAKSVKERFNYVQGGKQGNDCGKDVWSINQVSLMGPHTVTECGNFVRAHPIELFVRTSHLGWLGLMPWPVIVFSFSLSFNSRTACS